MSAEPQSVGSVDLHPPSHAKRYVIIAVLAVGVVVAVAIYNHATGTQDQKSLAKFDAFRAVYADKCNAPAYAGPQPEVINNDYLTSPGIQAAVAEQTAALNAGASCADVAAKLKKVDLHVPDPGAAQ